MPSSRAPDGPSPHARFGARAVLAAVALALAAVPFGLLLFLVEDRWTPLLDADRGVRDGLHGLAIGAPAFVTAMKVVSFVGSAWVYWPLFTAVAVWLVSRGLRRLALFVLVTVAGSAILNGVVKIAVDRARPVVSDPVAHANGLSFPSGHAQSAMVAYSVLLLVFLPVLRGRWRVAAVAFAVAMVLLIGFSRLALGVHFLSDVLAGYVLGAAWVAAMTAAFSAWRRETGRGSVEPEEGLEPESAEALDPLAPGGSGDGDGRAPGRLQRHGDARRAAAGGERGRGQGGDGGPA